MARERERGVVIDGVVIGVDPEAVVVTAARPLAVVASAVVHGGAGRARSVVNLHVAKTLPWGDAAATIGAFARRRALPSPVIGLLTAAWTENAQVASAEADGVIAVVAVTVGLSNPIAAGRSARAALSPSTINTIAVVDARLSSAALVNLATTVTEVKTALLHDAGVRCADGALATGTSTDAVVVAATGRGAQCAFGGPISHAGWAVASATRTALERGLRGWMEPSP